MKFCKHVNGSTKDVDFKTTEKLSYLSINFDNVVFKISLYKEKSSKLIVEPVHRGYLGTNNLSNFPRKVSF